MLEEPQQSGHKLGAGAIASLGGLAVLLIFIVQNTGDVEFHFQKYRFSFLLASARGRRGTRATSRSARALDEHIRPAARFRDSAG